MALATAPRPAPAAVSTLAAAVLRTGAWLYGGLWVIVAATSPWGPPGPLPVALLAPLAPLVLLATVRSSPGGARPSQPPSGPTRPPPALGPGSGLPVGAPHASRRSIGPPRP